ncbi:MAG: TlpA disulfide reductase family protein [Schleiferiaceae bacterium]|nr:TlpA disulfide reductase family protein [Schleiferiaceae bacterium]
MKRWLFFLMTLTSNAFAQSGADSEILYNANIVFSEQHTMHFQLAMTPGLDDSQGSCFIINGEERLALTYMGIDKVGFSHWAFPFQAELMLQPPEDGRLEGLFVKTETDERFRFSAEPATVLECDALMTHKRFPEDLFGQSTFDSPRYALAEHYDLRMRAGKDNEVHAVGEFYTHASGEIRGSVLTQTGDYRYLAGNRYGNLIYLSTFDGVHCYTFIMELERNGSLIGTHFSGVAYREDFSGTPNTEARLENPYAITTATEASLDLTLPDYASGAPVHIQTGQGNVTLIQVMGSWCPNCLDESAFFKKLSESHDGLDIYALAFERSDDRQTAKPAIERVANYLQLPYPILFAGRAERGAVEKVLPIENFISYPTYLLYDRQGLLVEVHAGFSGPATSGWNAYSEGMFETLKQLLEPQPNGID